MQELLQRHHLTSRGRRAGLRPGATSTLRLRPLGGMVVRECGAPRQCQLRLAEARDVIAGEAGRAELTIRVVYEGGAFRLSAERVVPPRVTPGGEVWNCNRMREVTSAVNGRVGARGVVTEVRRARAAACVAVVTQHGL